MTTQKRVLGIDYGSSRIGIALSDPLGIIAQPLTTLSNDSTVWTKIQNLIVEYDVGLLVVGMPFTLKGRKARKAEEVQAFIARLTELSTVDVVSLDERFTSGIAQQTLLGMGTRKKERRDNKGRVDAMAAALILQTFLDGSKNSLQC